MRMLRRPSRVIFLGSRCCQLVFIRIKQPFNILGGPLLLPNSKWYFLLLFWDAVKESSGVCAPSSMQSWHVNWPLSSPPWQEGRAHGRSKAHASPGWVELSPPLKCHTPPAPHLRCPGQRRLDWWTLPHHPSSDTSEGAVSRSVCHFGWWEDS